MPARRIASEKASRRAPRGFFGSTYDTLTSPDNATVVRSIAVFGVGVAILSSSFADFLLPPQ